MPNNRFKQIVTMGVAKNDLSPEDLPRAIRPLYEQIVATSVSAEDAFLKTAASLYTYLEAGYNTSEVPATFDPSPYLAPPETKPYMPKEAVYPFVKLCNQYGALRLYALKRLHALGYIVGSDILYSHLIQTDDIRGEERLIADLVGGNRLIWLQTLWGRRYDAQVKHNDNPWESGGVGEREEALRAMRRQEPTQGLDMLKKSFKDNSPNHRERFIGCLSIGLNLGDEDFLEEVMQTDRSFRVRKKARELLLSLEGSRLLKRMESLLMGWLEYKPHADQAGFLQKIRTLVSKKKQSDKSWIYSPDISYNSELILLGIERVSPIKHESDSMYILRQLAQYMPLSTWMKITNKSAEETAQIMALTPPFPIQDFVPNTAILRFKDTLRAGWAVMLNSSTPEFDKLIALLSVEQREKLRDGCLRSSAIHLIPDSWFPSISERWGPSFSRQVLELVCRLSWFALDKKTIRNIAVALDPSTLSYIEILTLILQDKPNMRYKELFRDKSDRDIEETVRILKEIYQYVQLIRNFDNALEGCRTISEEQTNN